MVEEVTNFLVRYAATVNNLDNRTTGCESLRVNEQARADDRVGAQG